MSRASGCFASIRAAAVAFALAAAPIAAPPSAAAASSLDARVGESDGWTVWTVPMIADAGDPCCYSDVGASDERVGCDLDTTRSGFSTRDHGANRAPADDTLAVYAHVAHARIDAVRAYAASCPVRSAHAIRRIGSADADESVALLARTLDADGDTRRHESFALEAIAFHATPAATRAIAARAEAPHTTKQREDALFWLGEARGADGAAIVEHHATTDPDPKLREHAVFALSQSHAGDPYARIHAIATGDPDDHVRSQALFWMAEMHDPRAAADITAALRGDASDKVREQAVFALSQLGDTKADDALIAVLRGDYPRAVKKQAMFWLAQSGSPRALAFFDKALAPAN